MNAPNLNGPESLPLRNYIEHLPLTVTVYDDKDNVMREEKIDYSTPDHRKWIGRVTVWACTNGFTVEVRKTET